MRRAKPEMNPPAPAWPSRLLLVGCGNMGGAMLAGWLAGGFAPERFTILDPGLAAAPAGVRLLRAPEEAAGGGWDALLLGVKPQLLDAVAPTLARLIDSESVVMSILAGVELASLAARLPGARARLRIMPNLAAAIGKSPVALVGQGLDAAQRTAITALMQPLGTPEWLDDERLLDAVTALGGSGPAFVYRFIAALAEGGVALGLPGDQALRLARAMVEGASALALAAADDPATLARRVASPGGTTEAGLAVLDRDAALTRLVTACLVAARDRGAQMAAASRG